MVTLGEIFRRYGAQYRARFGQRMSPEQYQAMRAIEACRTEVLGGHVYSCPTCATTRYSYHSCRNRHCPRCQQNAAQSWLAQQQALLLPVPHFLVTFTLPASLRSIARREPRTIYTLLFRSSAAALQQLAQDPRFLGGQIGMLGVLQT
jgi:transposase-like zinc-binding protein